MGDPPPGVGGSQTKQTFAAPFVIWLVPRRRRRRSAASLSGQIDAQFLSGVITHSRTPVQLFSKGLESLCKFRTSNFAKAKYYVFYKAHKFTNSLVPPTKSAYKSQRGCLKLPSEDRGC